MRLSSRLLRLSVLLLAAVIAVASNATELIHFDLQQRGAATLILQDAPAGRYVILVDAGMASRRAGRGGAKIRAYLNAHKITKIDLVILTHVDQDHAEGIYNLLGLVESSAASEPGTTAPARSPPVTIEAVLEPGPVTTQPTRAVYQRLTTRLWNAGVRRITPAEQATVAHLEHLFDIRIHAPRLPHMTSNDSSLGVVVHDRRTARDHFISGDMTARAWEQVKPRLPGHVETLTAPHHGGDPVLLDMVHTLSPKAVVVQANEHNQYGHPELAVLRSLASFHRTDFRQLARFQDLQDARTAFARAFVRTSLHDALADAAALRDYVGNEQAWALHKEAPYTTRTVLMTGLLGNIHVHASGRITAQHVRGREELFQDDVIWNELRYLSNSELDGLKTWEEAQAYLSVKAAVRLRCLRALLQENRADFSPYVNRPGHVAAALGLPDVLDFVTAPQRDPAWVTDYLVILQSLGLPTEGVDAGRALAALADPRRITARYRGLVPPARYEALARDARHRETIGAAGGKEAWSAWQQALASGKAALAAKSGPAPPRPQPLFDSPDAKELDAFFKRERSGPFLVGPGPGIPDLERRWPRVGPTERAFPRISPADRPIEIRPIEPPIEIPRVPPMQ